MGYLKIVVLFHLRKQFRQPGLNYNITFFIYKYLLLQSFLMPTALFMKTIFHQENVEYMTQRCNVYWLGYYT